MRYLLTLLLLLPLGLEVASAADVKPLVINSTTGRTEQLKAGDRLTLPDASGDLIVIAPGVQTAGRVVSLPVLTADTTVAVIGQAQTFAEVQTFSSNPLVNNSTPFISTSRTVGAGNSGFRFLDATSTFKNWQVAVQFNVSDGWEITPSTVNGGSTYSSPSITGTATQVTVPLSTASTSTTTGALVVTGGVGVGGALNAAGDAGSVVINAGSNARALATYINMNGAAGTTRAFTFQTAGNFRWLVSANLVAESGSDAGSNLAFNAYTDAGGFIDTPLSIVRAAGTLITLARPTSVTNATASTSTTTGALVVTGGAGFGGAITFNGNTGLSLRLTNATANASVATTLGSVGPTGSTAGNPQGWMRVSVNGTDRYMPFW